MPLEPKYIKLAAIDALLTECFRNRMVESLIAKDAPRIGCSANRMSYMSMLKTTLIHTQLFIDPHVHAEHKMLQTFPAETRKMTTTWGRNQQRYLNFQRLEAQQSKPKGPEQP